MTTASPFNRWCVLWLMLGVLTWTPAQAADTSIQATAFKELVTTMRASPARWWEDPTLQKRIQSIASKTGFDGLFDNTLVKFNEHNIAIQIVVIEDKRILYSHDSLANEQIFTSVEEAIAEIYGVNTL